MLIGLDVFYLDAQWLDEWLMWWNMLLSKSIGAGFPKCTSTSYCIIHRTWGLFFTYLSTWVHTYMNVLYIRKGTNVQIQTQPRSTLYEFIRALQTLSSVLLLCILMNFSRPTTWLIWRPFFTLIRSGSMETKVSYLILITFRVNLEISTAKTMMGRWMNFGRRWKLVIFLYYSSTT